MENGRVGLTGNNLYGTSINLAEARSEERKSGSKTVSWIAVPCFRFVGLGVATPT